MTGGQLKLQGLFLSTNDSTVWSDSHGDLLVLGVILQRGKSVWTMMKSEWTDMGQPQTQKMDQHDDQNLITSRVRSRVLCRLCCTSPSRCTRVKRRYLHTFPFGFDSI